MSVKKTTCDECEGTGEVGPFEYGGETVTRCPWCSGTGKVDVLYVLRSHGFNGDFSFSEVEGVHTTIAAAKRSAERTMKTRRYEHTLEDGTPTIRWMEIEGPGIEESLGLCEVAGRLLWEGC